MKLRSAANRQRGPFEKCWYYECQHRSSAWNSNWSSDPRSSNLCCYYHRYAPAWEGNARDAPAWKGDARDALFDAASRYSIEPPYHVTFSSKQVRRLRALFAHGPDSWFSGMAGRETRYFLRLMITNLRHHPDGSQGFKLSVVLTKRWMLFRRTVRRWRAYCRRGPRWRLVAGELLLVDRGSVRWRQRMTQRSIVRWWKRYTYRPPGYVTQEGHSVCNDGGSKQYLLSLSRQEARFKRDRAAHG